MAQKPINLIEPGTCLGAYLEEGARTGARPNSQVRGWRSKFRRIWGWLQRGAHPPPPQSRHKNVCEAVGAALGAPGHAPSYLTFFRELSADPEARSHAHHLAVLVGHWVPSKPRVLPSGTLGFGGLYGGQQSRAKGQACSSRHRDQP